MRRLFFYFDCGWWPTFWFFKSHENNMVYSFGIGIYICKRNLSKLNPYGFKKLEKLGPAFSETNRIPEAVCSETNLISQGSSLLRRFFLFASFLLKKPTRTELIKQQYQCIRQTSLYGWLLMMFMETEQLLLFWKQILYI